MCIRIAHHAQGGNAPSPAGLADQRLGFVRHAADQPGPAHEVERAIRGQVLRLGHAAFALFLRLHGTGDIGDQPTRPDGATADRVPTTHTRADRDVKGRLGRSGMRWTRAGAQAMLDVRSKFLNGDGEPFRNYRLAQETQRTYPHRQVLKGIEWMPVA